LDYILGVDGGATKTCAVIADVEGNWLAESYAGSSNFKSVGIENAGKNIIKAILDVVKSLNLQNKNSLVFKSACLGLSGNDLAGDAKIYRSIIFNKEIKKFFNKDKTIICNDTKIGLAAGSDGKNAVMIICGTGSNCFGINEENEEAKANGWDYILGDQGSGYEIGLKALKALMKAYDGRGESTLLSRTIFEDLKVGSIPELLDWAYSDSYFKYKVSVLASTVCRSAESGDIISKKILYEEAAEAFISVDAVVKKLNLARKEFDLIFVGSVFKCEKYFKNILMDKLKKSFSKINLITLSKKPVEGAIKLALKNLRV